MKTKQHTYATNEEVSKAVSEIIPDGHSLMGYSRDTQIEVAKEVVQRAGKSVRINAMQIHPSTSVSFAESAFRGIIMGISAIIAIIVVAGLVVAILAWIFG